MGREEKMGREDRKRRWEEKRRRKKRKRKKEDLAPELFSTDVKEIIIVLTHLASIRLTYIRTHTESRQGEIKKEQRGIYISQTVKKH